MFFKIGATEGECHAAPGQEVQKRKEPNNAILLEQLEGFKPPPEPLGAPCCLYTKAAFLSGKSRAVHLLYAGFCSISRPCQTCHYLTSNSIIRLHRLFAHLSSIFELLAI